MAIASRISAQRLQSIIDNDPLVRAADRASDAAFAARQDNPCDETRRAENRAYAQGYFARQAVKERLINAR